MSTLEITLLVIAFLLVIFVIFTLFWFIISEVYKEVDSIENGTHEKIDKKD
jgi:hypothetical protein